MKVGFSLGRCVRDIVKGLVDIEDVVVIIAGTYITSPAALNKVITEYMYRDDYLFGLDEAECQGVASVLWTEGKIHQSRLNGHYARRINEESVWADLVPTGGFSNPMVQAAWNEYRGTLSITESAPEKENVANNWRL
jgi:hypothetical protein